MGFHDTVGSRVIVADFTPPAWLTLAAIGRAPPLHLRVSRHKKRQRQRHIGGRVGNGGRLIHVCFAHRRFPVDRISSQKATLANRVLFRIQCWTQIKHITVGHQCRGSIGCRSFFSYSACSGHVLFGFRFCLHLACGRTNTKVTWPARLILDNDLRPQFRPDSPTGLSSRQHVRQQLSCQISEHMNLRNCGLRFFCWVFSDSSPGYHPR